MYPEVENRKAVTLSIIGAFRKGTQNKLALTYLQESSLLDFF